MVIVSRLHYFHIKHIITISVWKYWNNQLIKISNQPIVHFNYAFVSATYPSPRPFLRKQESGFRALLSILISDNAPYNFPVKCQTNMLLNAMEKLWSPWIDQYMLSLCGNVPQCTIFYYNILSNGSNFICEGESAGAQWVKWNIILIALIKCDPLLWHGI